MSEKHVIHHRGSPRPDPSPGGGGDAVWIVGGAIAVTLLFIAYWPIILGTAAVLAVVGGLGRHIWKLQKHALFLKKEMFFYDNKRWAMQNEEKNLALVDGKKGSLSDADFQSARTHAQQRLNAARREARKAANAALTQLGENERHLRHLREEVLKKATTTEESKLQRALAKIDSVSEFESRIREKLQKEVDQIPLHL